MVLLNTNQILYISLAVVLSLVVIILIALFFFLNIYNKKHTKELTYLKLKNIAEVNDYLLLNNYRINIDDKTKTTIDHILISNKFIIVITDFSISGVISGNSEGEELLVYSKTATSISNPLNYNFNVCKRLALFNDLPFDFIKGLVVVNNDSKINIKSKNNQFLIIKIRDLPGIIKKIDSSNVGKLKEESVVKFINYLNENNK